MSNSKLQKFLVRNLITIILAILIPIFTLLLWHLFQREYKSLIITVRSDVPIITVEGKYAEDIELKYKSKPVSSLYVVDFEIKNDGNIPIRQSDFDESIELRFPGKIIVSPEVVTAIPNTIEPSILLKDSSAIQISPLLLNPNDAFIIRIFLSNRNQANPITSVKSRIAGVNNVKIMNLSENIESSNSFWSNSIKNIIAILGTTITFILIVRLVQRFKLLNIFVPSAVVSALSEQIESNLNITTQTMELADQLGISKHNSKNNLLLIRIKIANLMNEIASLANLRIYQKKGPTSLFATALERNNLIDHKVAAAIKDIMPAMNREIHQAEAYLTDEEFAGFQRLGLNIIASLEQTKIQLSSNGKND